MNTKEIASCVHLKVDFVRKHIWIQETDKFRTHMLARLTEKNQYFGDFVEEIVDICTEVRFFFFCFLSNSFISYCYPLLVNV